MGIDRATAAIQTRVACELLVLLKAEAVAMNRSSCRRAARGLVVGALASLCGSMSCPRAPRWSPSRLTTRAPTRAPTGGGDRGKDGGPRGALVCVQRHGSARWGSDLPGGMVAMPRNGRRPRSRGRADGSRQRQPTGGCLLALARRYPGPATGRPLVTTELPKPRALTREISPDDRLGKPIPGASGAFPQGNGAPPVEDRLGEVTELPMPRESRKFDPSDGAVTGRKVRSPQALSGF
jgi:hypothetical protein